MNFELTTEQPFWFVLFCIALGILYAWILYRKEKFLDAIHPWLRRVMSFLRAVVVALLAFLLLSPLVKSLSRQVEKPIVIIAQDNSQSVIIGKDSSFYKKDYADQMKKLVANLSSKYDVKTLEWGDEIKEQLDFDYKEKQTDFSSLMEQMQTRYGNRNVGAVIIASDGLYNRGSNPLYTQNLKAPVYTIALGDTTIQKDLLIRKVNFNKIVYLGNSFPVEVSMEALQCSGAQPTLRVTEDSVQLFSKIISVSGNKFLQNVPVILDAKKKGMHHYKVQLSAVSGEITTVNNLKDIFIEVQESKQKILIVADAPHPDLAALKASIESSENYEVKIEMAEKFDAKPNDYNLVILHQLPSHDHPATEIISKLKQANVPVFYILGAETALQQFNNLGSGVNVVTNLNKTNPVQPATNEQFSLFTLSDETRKTVRSFPPLLCPYGDYRTTANDYVLFHQQIGNVASDNPLLLFNESAETKTCVLAGEGFWRWRLSDYLLNENFNASNELIVKTVQYLSMRETKTHFRLTSKNNFPENEQVLFDAEVYNDNYEPINTPDVSMTIFSADKKSFPFTFSRTEKAYTLNAGFFPPGNYRYKSTVKAGEKLYTNEGEFSVSALQQEQSETVADHQLLYALAKKTGGELFYPNQLEQLQNALEKRDDIKSVSYTQIKLQDLVNMKWVFFLLLALLSIEWFLRKRSGGY